MYSGISDDNSLFTYPTIILLVEVSFLVFTFSHYRKVKAEFQNSAIELFWCIAPRFLSRSN